MYRYRLQIKWDYLNNITFISVLIGLDNWEYGHRDLLRWPRGILCPQKLELTSPTSGGHLLGIVCSRTQAKQLSFNYISALIPMLLNWSMAASPTTPWGYKFPKHGVQFLFRMLSVPCRSSGSESLVQVPTDTACGVCILQGRQPQHRIQLHAALHWGAVLVGSRCASGSVPTDTAHWTYTGL
jgi:hypothetical protein